MKRKLIILSTLVLAAVMLCTSCGYRAPEETVAPVITPKPLDAQSSPDDDGAAFDYQVSGTITDHMVLQRNQYINVYGTSDKVGGIVYADFKGETRWAKVDENGKWHIQFNPQAASKEATELVVYNKAQGADGGVKYTDILIGDVWMVAGQSNAQVALESTLDNNPDFINTISADDNIRVFTQWYWDFVGTYFVDDETAVYQKAIEKKEMDNPPANVKWQNASDKYKDEEGNEKYYAQGFSAVGYYFAKKVADETDVPIGMIQAPAGGAGLHAFIPMDKNPEAKGVSIFEESDVYNCLMAPFAKTSIAGMLWYQGEANESAYYTYAEDLKGFIGDMRDIWGENMPFYNVQITSHNDAAGSWPNIQEIRYEQAELIGEVDNYYLACTMDYGSNSLDTDWAHPRNKKHIGDRLGYIALSQYYGVEEFSLEDYGSPAVAKVEIKGDEAKVYFKYVGDGLKTSDGSDKVGGFYSKSAGQYLEAEIVGKNCVKVKLVDRAGYSITGESFRLVYGTGAMADQTTCNLQNSNGIGAVSFAYTHIVE
ncbi:MAG: sialate O-acetylesterase [Ruminococcaceae bacterium]|nr:sialate O-acetylesterase [Oscillospiraceae bacterium]